MTPMADGVAPVTTRADPTLVKALARAFRYQRMLDTGVYCSVTDMAAGEKIDRGYLGRLLQLTLLAPDLVDGALDGKKLLDPGALTARLLRNWAEQRAALGE